MKKMLAVVLCLVLCMGVMALTVSAEENDVVAVCAKLPSSWTNINIYYWGAEGAGWPGTAMTAISDGWYYFYAPTSMIGIVLNNGNGVQTVDITGFSTDATIWIQVKDELDNGKHTYELLSSAPSGITVPAAPADPVAPPEDKPPVDVGEITVHAQVPESWTNVGAYVWNGGDNNAWPGTAMTLGDDGWYTVKVPGWAANVIINGDGVQTNDIAIESGKDIWVIVEASENGFVGTVAYEAPKTGETVTVAAAAALVLLAGTALVTTVSAKKKFF